MSRTAIQEVSEISWLLAIPETWSVRILMASILERITFLPKYLKSPIWSPSSQVAQRE